MATKKNQTAKAAASAKIGKPASQPDPKKTSPAATKDGMRKSPEMPPT